MTGVSSLSYRVAHLGVTECGHIDLGLYLITILKFDRPIFLKDFVMEQAAAPRVLPLVQEEPRQIPMSNGTTNRGTASSAAAVTDPRVPMQGITEERKREAGYPADDQDRATRG